MNGLAGYYVSTIGKPHEYFDLTASKLLICGLFLKGRVLAQDGVRSNLQCFRNQVLVAAA